MQYSVQLCLLSSLAGLFLSPAHAEDTGVTVPSPFTYDDMKPPGEGFTPFHYHPIAKRQIDCAASNSYSCPSGKCCPIGTQCDGDGVRTWCCPNGQTCDGGALFCPMGYTDCLPITGGDGCCPTATFKCATSGGVSGCAALTCTPGYFSCPGGSGCCPTGTTCIPNSMICQKPCDPGYSQCPQGCCDPSSVCDSGSGNCVRGSSSSLASLPTLGRSIPPGAGTTSTRSATSVNTLPTLNLPAPPSSAASALQAQWLGAAGTVLLYLLMF